MARPLRSEFPGAFYHATARGNERKAIYGDDEDRERFLELVAESVARFRLLLHGQGEICVDENKTSESLMSLNLCAAV